jgi:ADP-heptose:LPS heptosyltransferase
LIERNPIMSIEVNRIGIIIPKRPHFGAMIIQAPLFLHLRDLYPHARIKVWSPVEDCAFFLKQGLADETYVYKNRTVLSFILAVRRFCPDLFINLGHHSEREHLATLLSGAAIRLGFEPKSALLKNRYTATCRYVIQYRAHNYMNLFQSYFAGIDDSFAIMRSLKACSSFALKPAKKPVCFMPGGFEGEYKRWGIGNFIALYKTLEADGSADFVYFVLGSDEKEYVPEIESALPPDKYAILMNGSLADIVALVEAVTCTVANDCGPSHVAQLLRVNYVALFGWKYESPVKTMQEWFLCNAGSIALLADERERDIKTIPLAKVKGAVQLLQHLAKPVERQQDRQRTAV